MRYRLSLLIITCSMMLSGCLGITTLEYTVPDQYEGFMALYYECPGGVPVERRNGRVHITFDSQGVACIKDSYRSVFFGGAKHVAGVRTTSEGLC